MISWARPRRPWEVTGFIWQGNVLLCYIWWSWPGQPPPPVPRELELRSLSHIYGVHHSDTGQGQIGKQSVCWPRRDTILLTGGPHLVPLTAHMYFLHHQCILYFSNKKQFYAKTFFWIRTFESICKVDRKKLKLVFKNCYEGDRPRRNLV